MANLIGARIERKEDKKFLTGKGRYTADINLQIKLMLILFDHNMLEQKLLKLIILKQ